MTEEIIRKLAAELTGGVASEVQVVYLLAGIRKLIERDELGEEYPALNFHCDWVLHSKLDRSAAKAILREFDEAHALLKNGADLPRQLQRKIDDISKMRTFEEDLTRLLRKYDLPQVAHCADEWSHFLHLYTKIIQDIPLVVKETSPGAAKNISKVVVHFEPAIETQKFDDREEFFYRMDWEVFAGTVVLEPIPFITLLTWANSRNSASDQEEAISGYQYLCCVQESRLVFG